MSEWRVWFGGSRGTGLIFLLPRDPPVLLLLLWDFAWCALCTGARLAGADVTWTTGYQRITSNVDRSHVDAFNYNNFTLMPIVRFAWVNRSIVQLYSGFGIGATYGFYDNTLTSVKHKVGIAWDVTFIGITVGRKWFGYLDIGAGNRGTISAGVGYRFNNK